MILNFKYFLKGKPLIKINQLIILTLLTIGYNDTHSLTPCNLLSKVVNDKALESLMHMKKFLHEGKVLSRFEKEVYF